MKVLAKGTFLISMLMLFACNNNLHKTQKKYHDKKKKDCNTCPDFSLSPFKEMTDKV